MSRVLIPNGVRREEAFGECFMGFQSPNAEREKADVQIREVLEKLPGMNEANLGFASPPSTSLYTSI